MSTQTAVSEHHTLDTLDTLAHFAHATYTIPWSRYFSLLWRVVLFPVRLVWVPLSSLISILSVVFAPALYLFSYISARCRGILAIFISLQPLYTFFGIAAAVGIIAGLTLATSSSIITSYLGMQDDDIYDTPRSSSNKKSLPYLSSTPSAHIKDESSSNETDWYWPERSPTRRRQATGLLSQTILEEDDDSDI